MAPWCGNGASLEPAEHDVTCLDDEHAGLTYALQKG